MQSTKSKRILKKYRYVFEALENYDKTRELPFQRKRIDVTLSVKIIKKLKQMREKTGKSISRIIEEKIGAG
ncbi:MAG: ribbon-helix-helix protein, CopG family [Nanoarchaeota archaeon]|nr:ribbon-helix-helix protein, CopG family [Nanoarchaeota archaeon]MBU1501749.1 ribbon-helix-helix protein, CopG family [Nanoarchaeota archaeon]MBU2458794.1 ribbon-helix-helix protein, CopG family [Nanoarchaeota archaeon]